MTLAFEYLANGGALKRLGRNTIIIQKIVSHVDNQTLAPGTVTFVADSPGATNFKFKLGQSIRQATNTTGSTWTLSYNTLLDPNTNVGTTGLEGEPPIDFGLFVQGISYFGAGGTGPEELSPTIICKTSNFPVVETLPVGGWRSALAWSASYASFAAYDGSYEIVRGYQVNGTTPLGTIMADPTGRARNVIYADVPNDISRLDQPTSNTRWQSQGLRAGTAAIVEGDEFCVGMSYMLPALTEAGSTAAGFPEMYGNNDPEDPGGLLSNGRGFINLFQLHGPDNPDGTNTYGIHGSPHAFGTRRRMPGEDKGNVVWTRKRVMQTQDLYPGAPDVGLSVPQVAMQWVDVVWRIRCSQSIEKGWIETYVNTGGSTTVQPYLVQGKHRIPHQTRVNFTHQGARTDVQSYRRLGPIPRASTYFTAHKVTQTVAQADPLSYAI